MDWQETTLSTQILERCVKEWIIKYAGYYYTCLITWGSLVAHFNEKSGLGSKHLIAARELFSRQKI